MAPPSVKKYKGHKFSQSRLNLQLNAVVTQNFFEQTTQAGKKRGRPKKLKKNIKELPPPDANQDLLNDSESTLHVNRLDDTFDRLKNHDDAWKQLQMPKSSLQGQSEPEFPTETQKTEDASSLTCFHSSYESDKFDQLSDNSRIISKNCCGNRSLEGILPDAPIHKSNVADLSQDNCISMNKSTGHKKERNNSNKSMVSSTPITKPCRYNLTQSSSFSPVIVLNDLTNVSREGHLSKYVDSTGGSKSSIEVSTCSNYSRMNNSKSSLQPRSKSVSNLKDVSDLMSKSHVRKRRNNVMTSQDCLPIDGTVLSDNQSLLKGAIPDGSHETNSIPKYMKDVNVIRKKSSVSVLTEFDSTCNLNLTINESATGAVKTCLENVSQASNSLNEDWKNVNVVRKKSNITVTELDSIDNSIPSGHNGEGTEKAKTCAIIEPKRRSTRKRSNVFEGTLRDFESPDLFEYIQACDNSDCKCKINEAKSLTIKKTKRRIIKKFVKQCLDASQIDVTGRTSCLNSIGTHNVDGTSKLWESSVSDINESTNRDPHLGTNQIGDVNANSSHVGKRRRRRRAAASANKTTNLGIGYDVIDLVESELELHPLLETNNTIDACTSSVSVDSMPLSSEVAAESDSDIELNLYLSEDDCTSIIGSPKYGDSGEESYVSSDLNVKVEVNRQVDETNDIVESGDNSTAISGNGPTVIKSEEKVHGEGEVMSEEVQQFRRITRASMHSVKLINYNEDSNDSVFGPTALGDLLNYQNGTISKYKEKVKTKGRVKSKDVKLKKSKSLSQSVKSKNSNDCGETAFATSGTSTSTNYKREIKTECHVKSEEVKDCAFDSNVDSTTASTNLLNHHDQSVSKDAQEVKSAGKVKRRSKSLSESVISNKYTEDSKNTDFGPSDNPTITPVHLLKQDATVSNNKKAVNTKGDVQYMEGRKRRSKSFSQSVESKNYKKDGKDIRQDASATIPENSAGNHDDSVHAIVKANIPKRRRRVRSVHIVIKNDEKDSESHAQVAEPEYNCTTVIENERAGELHPVSTKKEPSHKEDANKPKRTQEGKYSVNTTNLVAHKKSCVEFRTQCNAVTPKVDKNGGTSGRKTKQALPSPSPGYQLLEDDDATQTGGGTDVIDLDEDKLPAFKSPPSRTKRFTFAKPFPLAPGKSWRRSLAAIKRNTVAAAVFEGQRCACPDCAIANLNDSSVGRRTIFSLSSAPAQPQNTSDVTEYEQNRLREAVALESFIENISLNVSQLSVCDNQRHYPSARQLVLQRCKQGGPLKFSKWYPETVLRNCHKIGEGVYGEVFLYRNPSDDATTVMKVIPIEGEMLVNGERQKQFEEILSEIVIASELSNLRNAVRNHTTGFNQLKNVRCVKGKYPQRLIELWELYEESKGTDNDNPGMFGADQLYIVLELANAGNDLESFVFTNFSEVYHVFLQIALTLAVGEEELQFEHRDLHWGNVLISRVLKDTVCTYKLNGDLITVPTNSVEASIIDFTLSRITCDKICFYNDLSQDPDLFNAEGDYQFEIYKLMQIANGNNWEPFQPKTNILWLHYILVKMTTAIHMIKKSMTAKNKKYFHLLVDWENSILKYKSAKEFVEEAIKPLYRSK